MTGPKKSYMNPYLAGILLGLVLLASFLILGAGLGASGAMARITAYLTSLAAPDYVAQSGYFGQYGDAPLHYYLVYMVAGIFLGGLFSAVAAGRAGVQVERGEAATRFFRIVLVLIGGILVGFASRMARGCTSGQALTGGALLLTGSLVFMAALFASGYLTAWIFRRQWRD